MNFKNILILFLVLLGLVQLTYAKEVITVVEITNQSLSDPMEVTNEPYVNDKQDLYGVQVDTTQFTKVDDLTLGDRVEFDIEYFDFDYDNGAGKPKGKYSKERHNIVMASVKPSDALIYVYSEPLQFVLLKGVIKDIDIDSDSINDIRVRYDGLDSETGYGILNVMRFNNPDYRILGNNFCEREDANSEFQCVEVLDRELGTFKLGASTNQEERVAKNQTIDEELEEKLTKDDGTETDKPVEQPKPEEDTGLSGTQIMMIIGLVFIGLIVVIIIVKIMKKVLSKKGSSSEYDDEEWD